MRRLKLFIHAEARSSGDFFLVGRRQKITSLRCVPPWGWRLVCCILVPSKESQVQPGCQSHGMRCRCCVHAPTYRVLYIPSGLVVALNSCCGPQQIWLGTGLQGSGPKVGFALCRARGLEQSYCLISQVGGNFCFSA